MTLALLEEFDRLEEFDWALFDQILVEHHHYEFAMLV